MVVNWYQYFSRIRTQCPWSWQAWRRGLIDIVDYNQTKPHPLYHYQARIYTIDLPRDSLEQLATELDNDPTYEWLWSEPGYGAWATPVPCLIQQSRSQLSEIRSQLDKADKIDK